MSTPEAQGVESRPLANLLDAIRAKEHPIDSVLVVRHGSLILDTYVYPFRMGLRHPVYSVTKSFASTLVGLAMERGALGGLEQTLPELFPEAQQEFRAFQAVSVLVHLPEKPSH